MTSARILRLRRILPRIWRSLGILLLVGAALAGLNACSAPGSGSARGGVCRVGPDGGPPASVFWGLFARQTDRGIGGTGVTAEMQTPLVTADRGIGGTGIVGVVTGFGSICVDGMEVAYDASAKVDIDGSVADPSQVRMGEVVRILAAGSPAAPRASSISVRIEVTGRIDAIHPASGPASGEMQVAGQRVLVPAGVPGVRRYSVGDWVAISGLRRPDGAILASRIEAASVDMLVARGPVRLYRGAPYLGALALPPGSAKQGEWVHVAGVYADGKPRTSHVNADTFCPNPYRCFPRSVHHLVLEAFLHSEGSRLRVDGLLLPARAGASHAGVNGVGIVSLERQGDGTFTAVDVRTVDPGQPGAAGYASMKTHVWVRAAAPRSRAGTVVDPATDEDVAKVDSAIANVTMPATPPAYGFGQGSEPASAMTSIPTSVVVPETDSDPEAEPDPSPEDSTRDKRISAPSSETSARPRGVPMSSATPAHGKTTLLSGSAGRTTVVTPVSAGSGGSQKGSAAKSITSPAVPSTGDSPIGTK